MTTAILQPGMAIKIRNALAKAILNVIQSISFRCLFQFGQVLISQSEGHNLVNRF